MSIRLNPNQYALPSSRRIARGEHARGWTALALVRQHTGIRAKHQVDHESAHHFVRFFLLELLAELQVDVAEDLRLVERADQPCDLDVGGCDAGDANADVVLFRFRQLG
ncbi:MAG TPA: hypothetical protein PKB10_11265, partial [Tepidisphaeraceae bacterium]|nr:hypothetical protein [Tepidisphaeraceae bacterium]